MESGLRRPHSPRRNRVTRLPRHRVLALVLTVTAGATITAVGRPEAAAADPRSELAAVRERIDTIGDQYFKAQARSRTIAAELETLRAALTTTNRNLARVHEQAIQTAVNLYRSQPRGYTLAEGESSLDAARSAVFAQQNVARSNATINEYERAVAKLRDDQHRLADRQAEARINEARLKAQASALDAALAQAQRDYAALFAAEAAQRAADATAATATTVDRTTGSRPATPDPSTPTTGTATTRPTTGTTTPPPPPAAGTNAHHNDPFLSCVRQRESRGYYGAVNSGGYYGAYQFAIRTWNTTAAHAGRPQLIGVRPDRASPWDQDELAWVLYQWQGKGPWGGSCG
jgi:septal ring factor EnvC (AmiA/AmiB activator)